MTVLSPARRVASLDDLEQAGDYTGPHEVETSEAPRQYVWYLLPVHQGADKFDYQDHHGSGVHGCYAPVWTFRECPDGSLEIRPSIAAGKPAYWHGYLDEGSTWRQVLCLRSWAKRPASYQTRRPSPWAPARSITSPASPRAGTPT